MKKLALALLLLLIAFVKTNAQVTWPTYYVTPPTSGCNGVWAINASATFGSCGTTPYSYSYTPLGCATTPVFSGDTLFLALCSAPCNMVLANSSGQTCSSSTPLGTGISESIITKTRLYPSLLKKGTELTMEFPQAASEKSIQVFDVSGKSVANIKCQLPLLKYDVDDHAPGMYYISISSSDGWTELHKIIIE